MSVLPTAQELYEIESEGLDSQTPRWTLANYIQELASDQSKLYWNPALEAFVLYREIIQGEYEIMNLSIRNKGQGKSKFLLQAFFEELRQKTKSDVLVYLEVRSSNKVACRLYLSQGFEGVGLRKRYYSNGDDAVLMKKKIVY